MKAKNLTLIVLLSLAAPAVFAQGAGPRNLPTPHRNAPKARVLPTSWPLDGVTSAGVFLLQRKDVQGDLKLSADQAGKVDPIVQQTIEGTRRPKPAPGAAPQPAKPATQNREAFRTANIQLIPILSQEQYGRLRSIHLQLSGLGAYFYSDIQNELALSVNQIMQLDEARRAHAMAARDTAEAFKQNRIDKTQRNTQLKDAARTYEQKVLSIVTADQQAKLKAIEGDKFSFAKKK